MNVNYFVVRMKNWRTKENVKRNQLVHLKNQIINVYALKFTNLNVVRTELRMEINVRQIAKRLKLLMKENVKRNQLVHLKNLKECVNVLI